MKKITFWKSLFLLCALIVGSSSAWADEVASFTPSNFSDQGTSGTGSDISATVNGVTFACTKGYGTTQIRCYQNSTITISSDNTITGISFTFSGNYNGGLSASYSDLSTNSWQVTLSSQARITAISVSYSVSSLPTANLSTSSLNFGKVTINDSKDLTFTVTPANLTGNLSISCDNNKYTVSPTSIAQDVTVAQTITVTASPTAWDDDMYGTITISGGGLASNKTVTLTATPYDPSRIVTYELVTSESPSLKAGDELLIVYNDGSAQTPKPKAMGAFNTGNYYNGVDVTIGSSKIEIGGNEGATILTLGGNEDEWTFNSSLDEKYLSWTSGNSLTNADDADEDNQKWTIGIDNEGVATIANNLDPTRRLQWNSGNPRFACYTSNQQSVSIYRRLCEEVTITNAQYATYCSATNALDFGSKGITAYIATDSKTSVALTEIEEGKVPANTPVVLYKAGANGTAINVPVIASAPAIEGTNDLCVSTGTDVDYMYVLAKKNGKVGFYKWAGTTDLSTGKIYLQGKSSYGAREFLGFDDTATGIANVDVNTNDNFDENAPAYNLAGQRVNATYKGVVIVNGKKVVRK